MRDAWRFHSPVTILFGAGRAAEVNQIVEGRPFVVTTRGARGRGPVAEIMAAFDPEVAVFDRVTANPTLEGVNQAIEAATSEDVGTIVALGGGSVMDTAKVVALAVAAPSFSLARFAGGSHEWDDVVPTRLVMMPTTAGTGAEVTPFATVWDEGARRKISVGTPRMHADFAVVDPTLTASMSWLVTLSTGLDALAQCFESVANRNATPITTSLALTGAELVWQALPILKRELTNAEARRKMAEAALLSGLAIAHTRTSLAHSMSYPVTVNFGLPHGLACALNLPAVLDFEAHSRHDGLETLAARLGLEGAPSLGRHLRELFERLGVRAAIREWIPSADVLRPLASQMMTPNRAGNSLRPVGQAEIDLILRSTSRWLEVET
jgi:alcohol dehydrogenase